jgi:hypothetical protein
LTEGETVTSMEAEMKAAHVNVEVARDELAQCMMNVQAVEGQLAAAKRDETNSKVRRCMYDVDAARTNQEEAEEAVAAALDEWTNAVGAVNRLTIWYHTPGSRRCFRLSAQAVLFVECTAFF